tara:strand:- start:11800 stop:12630 length:831 start_codon:yes stop_codon:yes gene_type:complete
MKLFSVADIAGAVTVGLVIGSLPASGQVLSPHAIIDLAVERAEEQRMLETDLTYEAIVEATTEQLDGDGTVKRTELATYRQYPLEGVVYEEMITKEGEPLDAEDVRSEEERRDKFIKEVRERRDKGEDPRGDDENRIDFNEEFVSRYDFWIVDEAVINDYLCWVIELRPRKGDLPVRRQIDNALNNSTGRIWVSQDDYGVARVEFEMAKSVRFWGGILGTLRNTVGRLEFERVKPNVWAPTTIDIRLDLRILFKNIRRRIVREWVEYRPLSPLVLE